MSVGHPNAIQQSSDRNFSIRGRVKIESHVGARTGSFRVSVTHSEERNCTSDGEELSKFEKIKKI